MNKLEQSVRDDNDTDEEEETAVAPFDRSLKKKKRADSLPVKFSAEQARQGPS